MEADDHLKTGRIIVRHTTEGDAKALSLFAAQTFQEAFGPDNKPSDMDAYLIKSFHPAIQQAEIAHSGATFLLALDREGSDLPLIGYVHLIADQSAIEMKRFYVAAGWQGRGLAQLLFHRALREARRLGGQRLWLSVWQRNPRAITFYKKMGLHVSGEATFQLGSNVQLDHVMEIAL